MKRAMCVFFPSWPLQRLLFEKPILRKQPVAIVEPKATRGARVLHSSTLAARLGVRAGMPVVEAEAIAAHVYFEEEDPLRDAAVLLGKPCPQ